MAFTRLVHNSRNATQGNAKETYRKVQKEWAYNIMCTLQNKIDTQLVL